MKKAQQDDLKDVGGFMAGTLSGPRRKANAVTGRDVITLDLDNIPAGGTEDVLRRVEALGCGYCIYSTRKHSPAAPRLRVLLPLDRTVSADEYEPLARKMAEYIGLELADPTTFEVSRLMYWPSCCADSQYIYTWQDKPLLSANGLLARYDDWRDCRLWPQVPGAVSLPKLAVKQGDPDAKTGVVGAFCRTYDVYRAMSELIPGMYEPVDSMPGRYTYLGGSTTGGAVIYDDGKFLYSHHATDPCSGRLVNAFDLVRIHLYGEQDEDASPDTPMSRRPSFLAMQDLASGDTEVKRLLNRERLERAKADFNGPAEATDDESWADELEVDRKGKVLSTIDNVYIILLHDPLLKGAVSYNDLKVRPVALRSLPWRKVTDTVNGSTWTDADDSALRRYLEKVYKLTGKEKIMDGMMNAAKTNAIHPIRDYLEGLSWDGAPRLDTLLVDYLGAEDTPYTRAVTRKTFMAAVARVFEPGCKFDYVLVLAGPQGRGKSTLVAKMANGWYTDSLSGIGTKEAFESIQGYWLVELGELAAMRKLEIETIKNFISKQVDSYRAAYGRRVEDHPRQCIFIGTTNSTSFLRDDTGNRRFWPVRLGERPPAKTVWNDLTPPVIDQLWAEAVVLYHDGEALYLAPELEARAQEQQEQFTEDDPRRGLVEDFLAVQLPADWKTRSKEDRQSWFMESASIRTIGELPREYISAVEVWAECFGNNPSRFPRQDRGEVNAILRQIPGWKEETGRQRCGPYGLQIRFRRVSEAP